MARGCVSSFGERGGGREPNSVGLLIMMLAADVGLIRRRSPSGHSSTAVPNSAWWQHPGQTGQAPWCLLMIPCVCWAPVLACLGAGMVLHVIRSMLLYGRLGVGLGGACLGSRAQPCQCLAKSHGVSWSPMESNGESPISRWMICVELFGRRGLRRLFGRRAVLQFSSSPVLQFSSN